MTQILFYVLSSLLNALVATVLSFIIFFKGKKDFVNKIFALFCIDVAVWSYSYFVWFLLDNEKYILFNHRFFLMGASIFIAILFFHSVLAITNKITEYKKFLAFGYCIFFCFYIIDCFTPFLVKGLQKELFFEFWPKAGIALVPFLFFWYLYIFVALFVIIKEMKDKAILNLSKDFYYREQLRYVFLGAIIGFGGAISNYFLWYDIMIPPVTNFLVSIGMILIIFSVLRNHLLNIKILISEILVFTIWIFVIIRMAVSNNSQELFSNAILTLLVIIIGILLIKSVLREVEIDKKLLQETQKNLDFERRLKDVYAQIIESESKIKYSK